MLVFPVFGLLWGGLFLLILGLEGLGVFVFLVFVFVFLCCFCFCFVCFVFVFLLDWFWCWFLFCFCFCYFFVFSFLFLFCVCFCCFLFFCCFVSFGGFKGQVRWPKGPPHLALNPPYFLFLFFVFFGGFKGQVRWPKGPPHLALNPPYFLFVFLGFCFSSLLSFLCFFYRQKTSFPPKKGHFLFIFQCLPLFLFSLFGASPLSSLSLSLYLSCSFLSSFLPVFHFLFLVLAFSFCCVCFFCFKMFFCFCCSACCLVLF